MRVISEWWIGKDLKGSSRGLILMYYHGVSLKELGKTTNPQDSWSLGRDFNPGPPEYGAGLLTTRPRCSVQNVDVYPRVHAALLSRRPKSTSSAPWEPLVISILCVDIPSGLFSRFPTKIYAFLISQERMPRWTYPPFSCRIIVVVFGEEYRLTLLIMQFFYTLRVKCKYCHQHTFPKHLQSILLITDKTPFCPPKFAHMYSRNIRYRSFTLEH
jgi:hypothetical protein